jgi:hypothetical protein
LPADSLRAAAAQQQARVLVLNTEVKAKVSTKVIQKAKQMAT